MKKADLKGIPGGKKPARAPSKEVVEDLELTIIGKLLLDTSMIPTVLEALEPDDLSPPRRAVLEVLAAQNEAGLPCSLAAVIDDLERADKLDLAGGPAALHELSEREATAADIGDVARRLHRLALESCCRVLHERIALGERSPEIRAELSKVEDQLEALNVGALDLADVGFSGARLLELRKRPERVSPFPGLFPPEPALLVLNSKPKVGKTTLAGCIAQAWACGVPPWEGAPDLPGSRALILSNEQPVERVDAMLRRMDTTNGGVSRDKWSARITIVARDPELPKAAARMLTLDETGRALLRQGLLRAKRDGDPYGFIVLDSLSRLTPPGFEENDTAAMTGWLAPLQELAEELETYILVVHHQGHAERDSAVSAGRGSSAIAAVAQAIWLLKKAGDTKQRTLKVEGNAIIERRFAFEVAGQEAKPGAIIFWKPVDPLKVHDVTEILAVGEWINTTELARRIQTTPLDDDGKPGRSAQDRASELRNKWKEGGLVEVKKGKGTELVMTRIDHAE